MDNLLKNIQLGGAIIVFIATIFAFGIEVQKILVLRSVDLGDLLLLFIYLEVLGMVASYWGSQRIQLTYPLFIAITAIARLIILQSKDLQAITLIYESAAILIISISILVLRIRRSKLIQVALDKNDL